MSDITAEAAEKLRDWLRLPVEDTDAERSARKSDIETLSTRLGSLVFEDERWYEFDSDRIQRIMQRTGQEWLDDGQVSEFESLTGGDDLGAFVSWFEPVLTGWERGEGGVAGDGEYATVRGLANPNFDADPVPGTQFYKYDPAEGYLYAESADATEWRTLEERFDAARQSAGITREDGRLHGYPHAQATIPGTRYYALRDDGVYVYSDREYGDDDHGWQPYEYWQRLRPAATAAPAEEQPPATIDAAVEDAAAAAFADLDPGLLAALDLAPEDIDKIAETVAAQVTAGLDA